MSATSSWRAQIEVGFLEFMGLELGGRREGAGGEGRGDQPVIRRVCREERHRGCHGVENQIEPHRLWASKLDSDG